LFLFKLRGMGIDFVLNEATAADVYRRWMRNSSRSSTPVAKNSCGPAPQREQHHHGWQFFEVWERRHFAEDVWAQLFQDAKHTADLLATVMDRRTQELKRGKQPLPDRGCKPKAQNM